MEIIQVCRDLEALRDISIVLILGTGDRIRLTEALGLLERLAGPDARIKIGGLVLQEIHRHIEELKAGAASKEDDFVAFGNVQQFAPKGAALIHHALPFLRTM